MRFRGFDLGNKKMISHEKLFGMDCSNEYPFLALLGGYCETYMEPLKVDIMQYTDIDDINNTEIYSGDIVKFHCNFLDEEEIEIVGEVIFKRGSFRIEYYTENSQGILLKLGWSINDGNITWIEVIGNIYENPELLVKP